MANLKAVFRNFNHLGNSVKFGHVPANESADNGGNGAS